MAELSSPGVPPFLATQESPALPSCAVLRAFGCGAVRSLTVLAHRGRNWEQANASMRPFLSDVFIGIAQAIESNGAVRRDEADARKLLESIGFFKPSRKAGSKSEEGEFIQKMFPMLGSEGSHSGRSDQSAAVYRYGLIVQTAHYFLARWERGPELPALEK